MTKMDIPIHEQPLVYAVPMYRLALKEERVLYVAEVKLPLVEQAVSLGMSELADSPHERLLAVFVNAQVKIIGMMLMATSSSTSTIKEFDRRGLCQAALTANASGLFLVHNHPSQDPTPSLDDINTTNKVERILEAIGIQLMDHIIITSKPGIYSSRTLNTDKW
jgi:DNA repair protein RadC